MDKYIFDENNGLWYELIGDYYFPCLTVPAEEEPSVGIWGQRHKGDLKECRPAFYNALLLSGKLNSYLSDIDWQAQEMMDTIIRQMAEVQGINEELKATNGAFQWPRTAAELRLLDARSLRWLMEGLSVEQPKAIRKCRAKDLF